MSEQPSEAEKKELLHYLTGFVSENKKQLFDKVIQNRTRYLTVVIEDLFQPHNISAVLRTCDCFGIQDVHIIENRNRFEVNPDIALGSSKWLTIHRYNSGKEAVLNAINQLKNSGYRIVAATPDINNRTLTEFFPDSKTALLFGTELQGLSQPALTNADELIRIPMFGFTESFNISVSVAIILHALTEKLRASAISWQLGDDEITDIKLDWVKNVVKRVDLFEQRFRSRKNF
jgi:tRNA (guanosine-2'-O-)-methyltransferase